MPPKSTSGAPAGLFRRHHCIQRAQHGAEPPGRGLERWMLSLASASARGLRITDYAQVTDYSRLRRSVRLLDYGLF
eukprot:9335619-Alexandrium_andersonii.AAC.1